MPMSAAGVASDSHPHSLKLEMALTPDRRDASASGEVSADVVEAERDEEVGGEQATEAELIPSTEMPHEAALRGSLNGILEETAEDEDELAALRDICQETLATMDRVAKTLVSGMAHNNDNIDAREAIDGDGGLAPGKLATFSAPKSPQERLLAFMPNAMEKGKSRLGRRPSCESVVVGDIPRWKTIDGNEDPITNLTVMFSGDAIPAGFTKLERSPSGQRADLNKGGRGTFVYLCQSKDQSASETPISEIVTVFPERGEFVPSDYEVVQRRGVPANLNTGTQGEKIYLCFKRSVTSAIVDLVVLFPKKSETLPYGYMKVDKSPDGHIADLNSSSGGTEVFLGYKKKLICLSDLHKKWLYAMVTPHQELERGSISSPRASLASTAKAVESETFANSPWIKPATPQKVTEVREQELLATPSSSTIDTGNNHHQAKRIDWKGPVEYHMYPLLLACYTRHGNAAHAAIRGVSRCLDAGAFDNSADLCRLEVAVDAVTSVCQQGIKSRFELALQFFRKVINRCSGGMAPSVLHAILKALTFIGDFDASLAKPLEDELIGKVMNQYEAEFDRRGPATSEKKEFSHAQTSDALARELVVNLIDDISTGAEIATATDHMLGAFKSHLSIQSPKFCPDMTAAMGPLAGSSAEETALQLVVTFSKAVNRKIVGLGDTTSESEHSSSVSSLRALNQTLLAAGTRTREHRVFGQVVRRFVLSTVTSTALVWFPGVFRANLTLISTLWTHYRRHLKVELALVLEHLLLRILRTTAPCAQSHQMDIMHELTAWLQLPHNVVEIFLNFDLDRVQQWKIFEHLCSTLCSMGEGNISHSVNPEEGEDVHLPLQSQAISTILAIARSVMDASGHAHLISRDQRTRMLSMDNGGWEQDESGEEPSPKKESISSSSVAEASSNDLSSDGSRPPSSPVGTKPPPDLLKPPSSGRKYGITSVRMRNELQKHNQQLLKRAMEISSAKSLKKAIEYLVAMNFVKDTPRNVTSFLRIYHDFFDEMEIGDYLGEGDEDFKAQVRLTYVRAISFKGMTLVESLRHFLTNGGFRLPGEAQKIERMVEAFAQCYWEDSPSSFSSADTAMIIAYSIIMLNTDLHNPQVKKNKMSREQFVKNNRGIDNGKDLPRRFLEEIYNDIAHNPMHIKGSNVIPKASREASVSAADLDNEKFRGGLAKAVAQSEELMKDLSHTYNTFQFVGVDASISPDLIKIIFERVWFSLLALATSILSDNQSDLSMRMQCLDLLRFCIPTCLFLNMPVERQAFCGLLRKVQSSLGDAAAEERQPNEATQDLAKSHDWVRNIEDAAASDDPWQVMGDIHLLVNDMKETIQCRQKSEELDSVIQRIHRGHFFLKDATTFIHEGDLTKKCRSRNQIYRFFLFNDQLLYADRSMTGSWSPHNSLRLKLTRISSLPDSVLAPRFAFQIQNPVKSFVVYADSASAKAEWMRLLDDAIAETSKKSNRNAQHISTQAAMGDTWSGSIVAAASTATTAMKVLMRLGSPLTSPTAAEREPSNFTDENPPATPTVEDRGQAAHASTRVDVEGESPATEIPATSMSPLAVLDDDHAVQTLATDGQDNAGAESLDRVDLDAIQPSSSSSKSEEGGSDAEATAMEDGSDASEVVAASDVEEAAELD